MKKLEFFPGKFNIRCYKIVEICKQKDFKKRLLPGRLKDCRKVFHCPFAFELSSSVLKLPRMNSTLFQYILKYDISYLGYIFIKFFIPQMRYIVLKNKIGFIFLQTSYKIYFLRSKKGYII